MRSGGDAPKGYGTHIGIKTKGHSVFKETGSSAELRHSYRERYEPGEADKTLLGGTLNVRVL